MTLNFFVLLFVDLLQHFNLLLHKGLFLHTSTKAKQKKKRKMTRMSVCFSEVHDRGSIPDIDHLSNKLESSRREVQILQNFLRKIESMGFAAQPFIRTKSSKTPFVPQFTKKLVKGAPCQRNEVHVHEVRRRHTLQILEQ